MQEPLRYSIHTSARYVEVIYLSDPTSEQWYGAMKAVLADPKYQSGFGVLLDRRSVTSPPTTEYIKKCVRFISDHREVIGGGRWAVVTSDLGTYGMGRMAEQLLENQDCLRAFRSIDEAQMWLFGPA